MKKKYKNDVILSYPNKGSVLVGGHAKGSKGGDDIFINDKEEIDKLFNEKVITNAKKYNKDGISDDVNFNRDENGVIKNNLIIKGENLLTLHTIKSNFAGKVKLIYIDPPYNTQTDSFAYNDNFNHSTWLSFMKNRLTTAKELLRDNGVMLVHCDFNEEAYLKVLMDEVIGRNNYLNSITIRDSHPSGLKLSAKNKTIVKTKSSILVYKMSNKLEINPIYQVREEWDTHFNTFLEMEGKKIKKYSLKDYLKERNILKEESFKLDKYALQNAEFKEFAFKNRDNIFQSTKEIPKEAKEESLKNRDKVITYGNGQFAFNGRRLSPLLKSINNVGFDGYKVEDFSKLLCDFWDDVDFNNSQSEGGVSLASGKKPEYLLARLITMFTHKEDIVLDFFLGSGTTCAVAHKMGRQYVGIEQMDYIEDIAIKRMQKVIDGEQGGISKGLNWQGGGEFIYFELDKYNQKYINKIAKINEKTKQLNTEFYSVKNEEKI